MKVLHAFYDLEVSPPTFDFIGFPVSAEMHRIQIGFDRIVLIVVPGRANGFRRDNLEPRDPKDREQMLQTIVLPMARLLPSCAEVYRMAPGELMPEVHRDSIFPYGWSIHGRFPHYGTDKMVQAMRAGCVPLRALTEQKVDPKLVTITLRNSPTWPARNSNLLAWLHLARVLRNEGFRPLFIPDGWRVQDVEGFPTDLRAALDLHHRAALHERAALNLFVNNGPAAVALFQAKARSLVFKMVTNGVPGTSAEYLAGCGLPEGTQWGRPGHRIVWEDDTADVLVRETLKELSMVEA